MQKPIPGIEVFTSNASSKEKKLTYGLVSNNAACTNSGLLSASALLQAGFHLTQLFSPEHGFTSTGADGESQPDGTEQHTGLPLISLYGAHMQPSASQLSKLDALLFDIPDIGCRFYTYLWTMTLCMEACAAEGLPFIVLDRPNPIGGTLNFAEGPWLDEVNCASFVGRWNIPIRHSCSLGELARYFAATRMPKLLLKVIPCRGWQRNHSLLSTPQWFTPTSPAIQNIHSAMMYPGTGFWEGLNIHDGRGTMHPFAQMGAPWIHSNELLKALKHSGITGVHFKAIQYLATTGSYKNKTCNGIRFTITNQELFRPVSTGIRILQALKQSFSDNFEEAKYPTLVNQRGQAHLNKLTGVFNSFAELNNFDWEDAINISTDWKFKIAPFLLYK